MVTTFADTTDLEARWRPLTTSEEQGRAHVLLQDASLRVLRRFPTINARIAAGTLDRQEVTAVVCSMVKRAMLSPAPGVESRTDGAGDFNRSLKYANPMGDLYFTAEDLATLTTGTGQVRSVRLTTAGDT